MSVNLTEAFGDHVMVKLRGSARFNEIIEKLLARSAFQKKSIARLFRDRDEQYWNRAENFAQGFQKYLAEAHMTLDAAVDAYLEMCAEMRLEQLKFKRFGLYSCSSAEEANERIYSSPQKMTNHLIGLALSQFLWPNHYAIYDYFIGEMRKLRGVEFYLEVGPGHGLYLIEALKLLPYTHFTAVDISPIAAAMAQRMVSSFVGSCPCTFITKDIHAMNRGCYDCIVMVEVLEHVNDPKSILKSIRTLLSDKKYFFLVTCANAPAIDHVYLYHSVDQIRQELTESGFEITTELVLPVEDVPQDRWIRDKIEINYAAMLRKA